MPSEQGCTERSGQRNKNEEQTHSLKTESVAHPIAPDPGELAGSIFHAGRLTAAFALFLLSCRTNPTTSFGNSSRFSLGFALFAIGMAAIRIPSTSFLRFASSTTNAEKKFQKL